MISIDYMHMSFNAVQDSFLLDDEVMRRDIMMNAASGMYLEKVNNAE